MADVPRLVLSRDHSLAELRRQVRGEGLVRLRRGAYTTPDGSDPALARRRAATGRIHATHAALRAPHVVSHVSAALLWGLPVWAVPTKTHVRQATRGAGAHSADIARHIGLPGTWVEIDGVPVTTLAETVLDCLLLLPPLGGLVIADAALARGLRASDVGLLLAASPRRNGRARALTVLELADAGAESAWETWLRYVALRAGLPRPVTQFPVTTHRGSVRVDLAWPEHKVLAEFDGAVKYVDGAFGSRYEGRRALMEEKLREDAISEALGVRPLRVVAADARDPQQMTQRLTSRFPAAVRRALRLDRRLPPP